MDERELFERVRMAENTTLSVLKRNVALSRHLGRLEGVLEVVSQQGYLTDEQCEVVALMLEAARDES